MPTSLIDTMNKRIKLLQIVNSLHPGGMENIVVEVCNRLDPARFAVTVCCLHTVGAFAERLRPEVRLVEMNKAPEFQWRDIRRLRTLMRGIDVVHTHHLGGLIHASLAKGLHRRPNIVHSEHIILHDWELERRRLWQRRLLYRAAWCVFALSAQQVKQLRDLHLGHRQLFILANGVDCSRYQPVSIDQKNALRLRLGLNPDQFWFGMVARFATAKRHMALIEAFEKSGTSMNLLLVGDGGIEKEKVLARITESPARNRIHWAGFQQDPLPWYQAMDVLVVASSFEGLPNAVLEGMACGLPVLANDVCGVREVAKEKEHGWIEDLSTVERLAAGLLKAANASPATLSTMGKAACTHVSDHFSLEAMLRKYDLLYTAAAEGKTVNFEASGGGSEQAC